jgi:integrase/recombinase XerC
VPAAPAIAGAVVPASSPAEQLLAAWLAGRSPETLRAYRKDLEHFAAFLGVPTGAEALQRLLGGGPGNANALVLAWRSHLLDAQRLAPASVNRRLASVRSAAQVANLLGLVPWTVAVPGVRSEALRDTRGPGKKAAQQMLELARRRTDPKGLRDLAILRCLLDLALRRAEVCRLDVEDLDPQAGTLAVLGKGKREKVKLTLPAPTLEALRAWAAVRPAGRGSAPPGPGPAADVRGPAAARPAPPSPPPADPAAAAGPLFVSFDRAGKGSGRLDGKTIYRLVVTLGRAAGVRTRTHGLRHLSISSALDALRGDVRKVKSFARHADVRTTLRYDDNRQDLAGEVARKVAEGFR